MYVACASRALAPQAPHPKRRKVRQPTEALNALCNAVEILQAPRSHTMLAECTLDVWSNGNAFQKEINALAAKNYQDMQHAAHSIGSRMGLHGMTRGLCKRFHLDNQFVAVISKCFDTFSEIVCQLFCLLHACHPFSSFQSTFADRSSAQTASHEAQLVSPVPLSQGHTAEIPSSLSVSV